VSYPRKVLQLRPHRGIASDVPAHEVSNDFYTTGQNVCFRNGNAQRIGGSRGVYGTLPSAVRHMLNARIGSTNFWLFFGVSSVVARETSNSNDITGAALSNVPAPWYYSSTLLNGLPVFTNGLELPRYWAGAVGTPFATLPGWPAGTICKSIAAFKGFLFALDIDGPGGHFENEVMWSDAAAAGSVPATWTPSATNLAGFAYLSDTPGPAMCAVPLRGSLIVYKRSGTYAFDLVNDINQVFSVRTLFTSSGALTRHAVADINGRHFVVGDGDIFITDGTSRASVAQGRMKDYLFGQIDQTNYENLFVIYHRAKNEVWVCYPESGNTFCTKALVYDVANDAFGVRDLASVTCAAIGVVNDTATSEAYDVHPETFDSVSRFFNAENFSLAAESLLVGYSTTASMQDTGDAVTVAGLVGRYDMTFGDPERVKLVRRVHVRAQPGCGTLYVRAGGRMTPNGSIAWSSEYTLTEPNQLAPLFAAGRYISIEIRGAGAEVWVIAGADVEYELRGYH
jgi:hypothetical protein